MHISSEKHVNSISENQFGIWGLPETVIRQDKLLQSHFVPGSAGLFLFFIFFVLLLRSLVKENAEVLPWTTVSFFFIPNYRAKLAGISLRVFLLLHSEKLP